MKHLLLLCFLAFIVAACNKQSEQAQNSSVDTTRANTAAPSIYDAELSSFVDQNGQSVPWSALKGKVRVMAMVFTHCEYACPRITKDIQNVEKLLPNKDPRIAYTLVSFDTERDTVGQLRSYYKKMGLDSNWLLLHGNDADTRTVSALLDVKYEKMADGAFSHQSIIFVIAPDGTIALRREGLDGDPKEIAEKVKSVLPKV